MIKSGEKKEEYRNIKPYWFKRLIGQHFPYDKDYDIIEFRNGYQKDSPRFQIECLDIIIHTGNPNWGAIPDKKYYVILLGEILKTKTG